TQRGSAVAAHAAPVAAGADLRSTRDTARDPWCIICGAARAPRGARRARRHPCTARRSGSGTNQPGVTRPNLMNWTWFHRLASPRHVYTLAARLTPWFAWPAALCIAAGLWGGLVLAPPDYQQGDGFRIIYVHAPSAWMSLMVYVTMAGAAGGGLIWRMKVARPGAAGCAPLGASFAFAALVSGATWGRPLRGTYLSGC